MKDIKEFENRIICGDCLEIMGDLPDKSIDLCLTDPPYGFERFKGDEKDTYIETIRQAFNQVRRVLKTGGWAFVFTGTGDVKKILCAITLDFRRQLWVYKPADCTFPYRGWLLKSEAILLFSNGEPEKLQERTPYHHDCYVHKKVGHEGVDGHPTVKPLWIISDLVSRSAPNAIILDPFLGSGTTAVACKRLNRRYIGIEINPDYCAIAEKRLANIPKFRFDSYDASNEPRPGGGSGIKDTG